MKLALGDRVETPEGPGTVVGTVERVDMFARPPWKSVYVLVEPDGGRHVRQWRAEQLEPFSSKAENQAEALYIERQQEAKHGEP